MTIFITTDITEAFDRWNWSKGTLRDILSENQDSGFGTLRTLIDLQLGMKFWISVQPHWKTDICTCMLWHYFVKIQRIFNREQKIFIEAWRLVKENVVKKATPSGKYGHVLANISDIIQSNWMKSQVILVHAVRRWPSYQFDCDESSKYHLPIFNKK